MIRIPRFKITSHPNFKYYVMQDALNSGPKYIMLKQDLYELAGHIAMMLGNVKLQKIIKEESKEC